MLTRMQWTILLISASTDAIISGATALSAAMMANEMVTMPNKAVILVAGLGASVAFARTVQQRLKKVPGGEE